METFGQYIRRLRNSAGYTLTQLAAKLEMDSANLSKIENGKRIFDEKKLELLAKIFSLNNTDLKNEYYAEKIAISLMGNNVSPKSLKIAEQKIKYLKNNKN
ncbi:MAG TPA: helix-turn-helix transcriptional regulator [Ignavibacteriaceae bacterium]|nr:helix-turn-helix transcriptional regulator [Ignavibacteriaceae bacterium]